MKNDRIIRLYDSISLDERMKERMLANILNHNKISEVSKNEKIFVKNNRMKKSFALVIICLATFFAIGSVGYGFYQKWFLPKPEIMERGNNDMYDIKSKKNYSKDELLEAKPSDGATKQPYDQERSDNFFIEKTTQILKQIGLNEVNTDEMSVIRQTNLKYNRKEAEVRFVKDKNKTGATFHATTGDLISLTSLEWIQSSNIACKNEAEALVKAEEYYKKLPVPQGYIFTHSLKYDDQCWSFCLSRKVMDNIYNEYEQVRIVINPVNGRIVICNVFSFPLLDDHKEGDVALTQMEAKQKAQEIIDNHFPDNRFDFTSAEIVVSLPNWIFTQYQKSNLRVSEITRLAWKLTFKKKNSTFESKVYVDIDLYTGEILGGDVLR